MGVRARYELVPPLHPAFDYWAPRASASAQVHNSCKGLSIWVHQFAGIYRAEFVPTVIREAPNPVGITEFSAIFGKKADAGRISVTCALDPQCPTCKWSPSCTSHPQNAVQLNRKLFSCNSPAATSTALCLWECASVAGAFYRSGRRDVRVESLPPAVRARVGMACRWPGSCPVRRCGCRRRAPWRSWQRRQRPAPGWLTR